MIVIVDYGMGNLRSIAKKLEMIKVKAIISSQPEDIRRASKLILPGVGHFGQGIKNIKESGLLPLLNKKVLEDKTPILGVCLGMQLFADSSEEGNASGLGWVHGKVVRFNFEALPGKLSIPHVGWNTIDIHRESILLKNIDPKTRFYFTHSYHYQGLDPACVVATTPYGYDFPTVIQQNNVYGTQFHPEKSHLIGLEIYKNFIQYT